MLSIRSGQSEMTDEMKQLLKDEGNPLLEWMKKATPEQLSARSRKRAKTMGPDRLSEAARKGHANKDEEGKSLAALQRAKTMGPDRLSEAARKGHAKKDEEGRSLKGRKSSATRRANNPLYRELTETTAKGTTQEKKLGEDGKVFRCNRCKVWAMNANAKINAFKYHRQKCTGKK
eukprot:scaffold31325_cov88-Skeletonema_marinoi.AAC.1